MRARRAAALRGSAMGACPATACLFPATAPTPFPRACRRTCFFAASHTAAPLPTTHYCCRYHYAAGGSRITLYLLPCRHALPAHTRTLPLPRTRHPRTCTCTHTRRRTAAAPALRTRLPGVHLPRRIAAVYAPRTHAHRTCRCTPAQRHACASCLRTCCLPVHAPLPACPYHARLPLPTYYACVFSPSTTAQHAGREEDPWGIAESRSSPMVAARARQQTRSYHNRRACCRTEGVYARTRPIQRHMLS